EIDGIKYLTMPYVEGRDLASVLRDGPLPAARALGIARQIAAGLLAAHDAGVVHRDLKPENVMIDADGHALIMDFGISRSMGGGARSHRRHSGIHGPGTGARLIGRLPQRHLRVRPHSVRHDRRPPTAAVRGRRNRRDDVAHDARAGIAADDRPDGASIAR